MLSNKGHFAAALVYLAVYLPFASIAIWGMTMRKPWASFVPLSVFAVLRIAIQIAGIGLASVGFGSHSGKSWLIAYLVLGAEGYFSLVQAALYCVNTYMHQHFKEGSWLEPSREHQNGRVSWLMPPIVLFNLLMVAPIVLVVVGGAKVTNSALPPAKTADIAGRQLYLAGSALFLAAACIITAIIVNTFLQARSRHTPLGASWLLMAAAPLIVLRGVLGVLESSFDKFSFWNPGNYSVSGLSRSVLLGEYVMGAYPEFFAAMLLLGANWMLSDYRNSQRLHEERAWQQK